MEERPKPDPEQVRKFQEGLEDELRRKSPPRPQFKQPTQEQLENLRVAINIHNSTVEDVLKPYFDRVLPPKR